MAIIGHCLLILFAFVLQFWLMPAGELPLAVLVTVLFFLGKKPALLSAVILGFLLDLFSPVFGLHLVLYAAIIAIVSRLSAALFTDQSFPSFAVLSLGSYVAYAIGAEVLLFAHAVFSRVEILPPLVALHQFGLGFALQCILTGVLYILGSRISRRYSRNFTYAKAKA